jgi:MYXO-CTERM domain-containing protein
MRLHAIWLPAAAVSCCAVATANAATFSFASDSYDTGPTWELLDDMLTAYDDAQVDLLVDVDEDGPGEAVTFEDADFDADITLDFQQTTDLGGGLYLHIFTASGTATWTDAVDGLLLQLDFFNAAFTGLGGSDDMLGSAATLSGEDFDTGAVSYTPGQPLIDLGLSAFFDPQDFAFTLTDINDGAGVSFSNGLFDEADAEGSFSGSAIPAPGSLALLGLTGLCARRRR